MFCFLQKMNLTFIFFIKILYTKKCKDCALSFLVDSSTVDLKAKYANLVLACGYYLITKKLTGNHSDSNNFL